MNHLRGRNLDAQIEKSDLEIQAFKDFDHVYAHCSPAIKIRNIFKNKKDIEKSFGTHILEGLNNTKIDFLKFLD